MEIRFDRGDHVADEVLVQEDTQISRRPPVVIVGLGIARSLDARLIEDDANALGSELAAGHLGQEHLTEVK